MEQIEREAIPTKIISGDRRLTMRLMGLWQGLRGAQRCAAVERFVAAVPEDLLDDCFLVVPGEAGAGQLQRIGETVGGLSGVSGTTQDLALGHSDTLLGVATRCLDQVLSRGAAFLDDGEFHDRNGRRMLFRAILLPLQDKSGRTTRIFGGARCTPRRDDS